MLRIEDTDRTRFVEDATENLIKTVHLMGIHYDEGPDKGGPYVQRATGIPVRLFTTIFSLARTVGWIAQLNEMIGDPEYKIGRPRQLYAGAVRRDIQPIAKRR